MTIECSHRGRGFSYFSCYGNSFLYNEIGGYTIQFYHQLEQLFRSYCHKNIGFFVYNPMGGVQLLYTKWVTHSFSMGVANIQILINCKSFNISEVSFPNLELSAYKTLLPQQVIIISHTLDENAL